MLRRWQERALGWIACLPARAQRKLLGEMVLLPQGLNGTLVRAAETELLPRTVILEQISGRPREGRALLLSQTSHLQLQFVCPCSCHRGKTRGDPAGC